MPNDGKRARLQAARKPPAKTSPGRKATIGPGFNPDIRREESSETSRQELNSLLRLAVPVVLSELGWMAMSVVDTTMVGRLSAIAIGAVGLGSVLYHSIVLFGMGLLLGMDPLVAQAYGAGNIRDCHRTLYQGMYLALALTAPLMLLSWFLPPLLIVWNVNPLVVAACSPFIRTLSWSTLPLLLYAALRRYLQAMKLVAPVMFALLSANLVNWLGNWVFIYGHFGFRPYGILGSAWSTLLARIYMVSVLAAYIWLYERKQRTGLFHHPPAFELQRLRRMVSIGLPAASQIILEVGAFAAATVMAGKLTPAVLAAHQIALNCASLTYMVPLGISSATAVSVGHALGRRDLRAARGTGWVGIALGAVTMFAAAIAFISFPQAILRFYTSNEAVIAAGSSLLMVAAFFQLFDGIQTVTTGALRGLGNTHSSMLANFVSYWLLGLPLSWYLCFVRGWGAIGIWSGLSFSLTLLAVVLILIWRARSADYILPTPSFDPMPAK